MNTALKYRIVFLPNGSIAVPPGHRERAPTATAGRGVYFADRDGLNYFRVTIYSDGVARRSPRSGWTRRPAIRHRAGAGYDNRSVRRHARGMSLIEAIVTLASSPSSSSRWRRSSPRA